MHAVGDVHAGALTHNECMMRFQSRADWHRVRTAVVECEAIRCDNGDACRANLLRALTVRVAAHCAAAVLRVFQRRASLCVLKADRFYSSWLI